MGELRIEPGAGMESHHVAACIRQDPESWKGISFLYLRPSDSTGMAAFQTMLAEHNTPGAIKLQNRENFVLLGLTSPSESLAALANRYVWIPDITAEWSYACSLLELMVTKTLPSLQNPKMEIGHHISLLIVEDEPMTSRMVTHHLKQFGSVISTANGREAVANYMVQRPDVVFLDIHYGNSQVDGFDVLTNLLSADANAFVVMLSADRNPRTVMKALTLGAQGFIGKPFSANDFAHYLAKFARAKAA